MSTDATMPPIAVLNARYPGVSHTFVEREIRGLRALGAEVHPFTIRPSLPSDRLGAINQAAAAETYVLYPHARALVGSLARLGLTRAGASIRTTRTAARDAVRSGGSLVKSVAYVAEAGRLAAEMRRRGVGHVHVHGSNVAATVARLACVLDPGLTYSLTIHGSAEFFDVTRLLLRENIRGALFVRCISEFCRSQVMAFADTAKWERCHIVHCGIEPAVFAPASPRLRGAPLRLITVGRLHPIKGLPLLLRACAELPAECGGWTLEIVGDGPMEPELRRLAEQLEIAGRVRFAGALSPEDVAAAYGRADVFVMSSFMEGLPVVLMEAMAAGLVAVSTNVAGVPELVEDGRTGFLVRGGSSEALRDVLMRIAREIDGLRAVRAAAREKVVAEFDVARSCGALKGLFGRYVGGKKGQNVHGEFAVRASAATRSL
jgi:glycosyltransferase involved in cell wall biosynthesis